MKQLKLHFPDGTNQIIDFKPGSGFFPATTNWIVGIEMLEIKTGKGRKASDPAEDLAILKMHEDPTSPKTIDELAQLKGVSSRSICKAISRARQKKVTVQTATGPYTPSEDQKRAAAVLLFGKVPGGHVAKADLKQIIKKNL